VFGSVARGEDRPDSDLDILVDTLPGTTLFDLGGLLEELSEIMEGTEIHISTPNEFPEKVRRQVLLEAKPV
jgi:predicted nucleotidyltransferase